MNNRILNFNSFRLNESTYTEFHVNFKDDLFKSKVIKEISMRKLQIVDEHGYVFKFKPDMYEDYNEIQFASSYDLRCGLDIYKPDTMLPGYNINGNVAVLYEEQVPVPHSSYEIFSSCCPTASLLEGVNIGSCNFADSFKLCGSFIPHTA